MPQTINRNVEIRDLPIRTHRVLSVLARMRGIFMWEIFRDALNEYAINHKGDIAKMPDLTDQEEEDD